MKKFRPGARILSLSALAKHVEFGRWIYLHGTPKHPKVLMSMTLNTLRAFLGGREGLLLAEPTEKE